MTIEWRGSAGGGSLDRLRWWTSVGISWERWRWWVSKVVLLLIPGVYGGGLRDYVGNYATYTWRCFGMVIKGGKFNVYMY